MQQIAHADVTFELHNFFKKGKHSYSLFLLPFTLSVSPRALALVELENNRKLHTK